MSRLKDEVIEDASKLGEIIDLCKHEVENTELNDTILCDNGDDFIHYGRKELAKAVLKILGLLEE